MPLWYYKALIFLIQVVDERFEKFYEEFCTVFGWDLYNSKEYHSTELETRLATLTNYIKKSR